MEETLDRDQVTLKVRELLAETLHRDIARDRPRRPPRRPRRRLDRPDHPRLRAGGRLRPHAGGRGHRRPDHRPFRGGFSSCGTLTAASPSPGPGWSPASGRISTPSGATAWRGRSVVEEVPAAWSLHSAALRSRVWSPLGAWERETPLIDPDRTQAARPGRPHRSARRRGGAAAGRPRAWRAPIPSATPTGSPGWTATAPASSWAPASAASTPAWRAAASSSSTSRAARSRRSTGRRSRRCSTASRSPAPSTPSRWR